MSDERLSSSTAVQSGRYCDALAVVIVVSVPMLIGMGVLRLWGWDLSIPMVYLRYGGDETWQLALTKALLDTGWILTNPFLGAPDVAHWHNNSAGQASALHSVLMRGLGFFIGDAVKVQQVYFLLNFSLISLTSFVACRLLGISNLPAAVVGILFSLISYRFNFIIYSFLANYFAVPLAIVPIFWIMMGDFSVRHAGQGRSGRNLRIRQLIGSNKFLLGLSFTVLIALTDGYYAFFTLLLITFASFIRGALGDWRAPGSFLVPGIFGVSLVCVSSALLWPIAEYKWQHREEFFPNGVEDPVLVKHPFEAEVYASSLKLLVAPPPNHRIPHLSRLGQHVLHTSETARQFKMGGKAVRLGFMGSILFAIVLTSLILPKPNAEAPAAKRDLSAIYQHDQLQKVMWVSSALALFIFLCSISGGLGTLVALIFPTIRAYDRFPLFLLFVLYVWGGAAITLGLARSTKRRLYGWQGLVLAVAAASAYDQIPGDAAKVTGEVRSRFLAERDFVRSLEASLPPGAMVYHYPHSQYLMNSRYYGWGAWGHIRLYLHSRGLRWSNGASKNSPVDEWHNRLGRLPVDRLVAEVAGAGFDAFVVDRTVVRGDEYERVRQALLDWTGSAPIEDEASNLAFAKLRSPGFRVIYDPGYRTVERLIISDSSSIREHELPRLINANALAAVLRANSDKASMTIERVAHPAVFADASVLDRGTGETPISVPSDMKGELHCAVDSDVTRSGTVQRVTMKISNRSDFDWHLNSGAFPLGVGYHLLDGNGTNLVWDSGFRLPAGAYIARGGRTEIEFPLDSLKLGGLVEAGKAAYVEFAVVQDGNRWFGHLACRIPLGK